MAAAFSDDLDAIAMTVPEPVRFSPRTKRGTMDEVERIPYLTVFFMILTSLICLFFRK